MVQVYLSQKHKKLFEKFYFHILARSQIWLVIHVHHHHFGCITKLTPKKKKNTHYMWSCVIVFIIHGDYLCTVQQASKQHMEDDDVSK
jgi:hypothetical protein